jgi:hypothetical protein
MCHATLSLLFEANKKKCELFAGKKKRQKRKEEFKCEDFFLFLWLSILLFAMKFYVSN